MYISISDYYFKNSGDEMLQMLGVDRSHFFALGIRLYLAVPVHDLPPYVATNAGSMPGYTNMNYGIGNIVDIIDHGSEFQIRVQECANPEVIIAFFSFGCNYKEFKLFKNSSDFINKFDKQRYLLNVHSLKTSLYQIRFPK